MNWWTNSVFVPPSSWFNWWTIPNQHHALLAHSGHWNLSRPYTQVAAVDTWKIFDPVDICKIFDERLVNIWLLIFPQIHEWLFDILDTIGRYWEYVRYIFGTSTLTPFTAEYLMIVEIIWSDFLCQKCDLFYNVSKYRREPWARMGFSLWLSVVVVFHFFSQTKFLTMNTDKHLIIAYLSRSHSKIHFKNEAKYQRETCALSLLGLYLWSSIVVVCHFFHKLNFLMMKYWQNFDYRLTKKGPHKYTS